MTLYAQVKDTEVGTIAPAPTVPSRHVGCVLRHQLARRRNHRMAAHRRHRLNPDSASRDHVRATHRHVHHHPVT